MVIVGNSLYRWLFIIGMCIALLCGHPAAPTAAALPAQGYVPRFDAAPCMFDIPPGLVEGQHVECGYVTVPEEHSNPDGGTIRLAVAIFKSQAAFPLPDPLVLAQGGPGGSTIETYALMLAMNERFPSNRDIVLFDQRGTLYSQPSLTCQEVFDLTLETIDEDIPDDQSMQMYNDALFACRERLVQEGVNLSAYDSLENAADIDDLRIALGYEQINLYGVSYGTLMALHTMRHHPAGLRSVVLDAVVPPQTNFLVEAPQSLDRGFTTFFDACAADHRCNSAYPDLERVFFEQVERLNEQPVTIPVTDPDTGKTYQAFLDGASLHDGLLQMLYSTEVLPVLPRMIYEVRDDRYDALARILSMLIFDRSISYGMYYSIVCSEDADFEVDDLPLDDVRPSLAENEKQDAANLLDICERWNVEPLGPSVDEPVVSEIPTLILSGRFDPITPPAFGETAAETLVQGYPYTFAHTGHGAAFTGPCADQVMQDFLDTPTVPPDASCMALHPYPDFLVPSSLLVLPSLLPLINLEGTAAIELLVFVVCLLVVLSIILVWPLTWLIRLIMQRKQAHAPLLAQLLVWLSGLNGLLMLAFIIGVFVVALIMAFNNDITILFGVPTEWAALFILPIISTLLTVGMLVTVVQSWRQGYWHTWQRVYYTLVTLAASVCVVLLGAWGMVGVVFLG